jgi:hypothetical protein
LSELEEYDCQVECCSKIMRTIMNTLRPYYDLLQNKKQAVKQLKLDIFLKKVAQKNAQATSSETSDEPLPSTSSGKTQKPPALFL